MPPDHFVTIRPPLFLDPACEYIDTRRRTLDADWVTAATAALDVFSSDVAGWAGRSAEEGVVCLRFELGDELVSEAVFDHESVPDAALPALRRFVSAVAAANQSSGPLWSDDEHPLGDAIAVRIAERWRAEVPTFVRFLETNDLDHEVDQPQHIERVVRAHGWCPQTMALWVARLGTCAGQHGHETPWHEYGAGSLAEYLRADDTRRDLLMSLMAGNMAALVEASLEQGPEPALTRLADNRSVYWGDLEDQGLEGLASDIAGTAYDRAEKLVRSAAESSGPRLSEWINLPPM